MSNLENSPRGRGKQTSRQSKKPTTAEILCKIDMAFEKAEGSKEAAMSALVAIHHTGNPKIDNVVKGYAKDTLRLWRELQQERAGSGEPAVKGLTTAERLLNRFSEEYAANPSLENLDALVAKYKGDRKKLPTAIEGYAKVLRQMLQAKQQEPG